MTDNFCRQRRLNMLFHVPTNRDELVKPDPNFTTEQLNMRRKVEILKYNKNINKNNGLTQKNNFARLSRGNYKQNRLVCENDHKIPTSSSNSDIPGPSLLLFEDKSVPLYNYNNTNIDRYNSGNGISYNNESDREWTLYNFSDLLIANNERLSILTIYDNIKNPSYTYTFTTPIYTNIYGTNLTQNMKNIIYTFTINYITLNVYYNDNLIYTQNSTPEINKFNYTISPINNSGSYDYNLDINNGNITFNNIVLPTSSGFNYEFKTNILTTYVFNTDDALEQNTTTINNAINYNVYINSTKNTFDISNVTLNTSQSTNLSGTTITAI
jgi:hypothetical protein